MKDIDLMVLGKLRSSKDNEIISLSMKSQLLIERYNITWLEILILVLKY